MHYTVKVTILPQNNTFCPTFQTKPTLAEILQKISELCQTSIQIDALRVDIYFVDEFIHYRD